MRSALAVLLAWVLTAPALVQAQTVPPSAIPLSLDAAIGIALQHNPHYLSAAASVDAAVARVRQARAPELPGLAIEDTYQSVSSVAKLSTPLGEIPFSTVNATNVPLVALQYTLFDGGLTAAHVSQSVADLSAAEANAREARGETIAHVAAAYYGLIAALDLHGVAQRATGVASAHVERARQMLSSGMIPRADLLRAQSELADEQVREIASDNAVNLARAALDNVLSVPITTVYDPTDPLDRPAQHFELQSLLQSAHSERGELVAALASVTAAERAVAAAQSGYFPHINATVSDGNTQPAVVGGYHNQFSIGLSAVWTLFDNGLVAGRVAEARAGVRQAQLAVTDMRDRIDLQVDRSYLNLAEATAKVAAAERLVSFADETLRLAQVRYRGGVGTALELQDAELRDRSARQTLVTAQAAVRQDVVDVRFAAGLL